MTTLKEQQRAGEGEGGAEEGERKTMAREERSSDGAAAATLRPRPTLRRSLPSDPDLAKRVLSVPDAAVEQVKKILLAVSKGEEKEEEDGDASLVAEFLSGGGGGGEGEEGEEDEDEDDEKDDAPASADADADVDATVNQFLRAVGGTDARAAAGRLLATLRWRRDARPHAAACQTCLRDPGAHYQHVIGKDSLGRPVIYSVLSLARGSRDVGENVQHMVSVFEAAIRMMEHEKRKTTATTTTTRRSISSESSSSSSSSSSGGSESNDNNGNNDSSPSPPSPPSPPPLVAEQWIWVSDLFGFTASKDLDPRVAKAFIGLLGTHYPERLARFVIVGAPALFSALWSALKRHVCDDTARKIAFVKWDGRGDPGGKTALEFEELGLGGKLGEWILRECRQNRCPVASAAKRYPYGRAHEGEESLTTPVVIDGHDLRGTEEHVAMLRENPALVAGFCSSSELSERVAKLATE